MPSAGRIRPNTTSSGRFTTPRQRPVSTITFRTTLVNSPKKPFQSPGTHHRTAAVPLAMRLPPLETAPLPSDRRAAGAPAPPRLSLSQSLQKARRVAHPAEDTALRLDHCERGDLKLREVRADAILEHEAVITAVVRLADRRVHAHLGRDPADDEPPDALVAEHRVEVGGVERALAGLVDDRFPWRGLQLVDEVVTVLPAHQDAAHWALVADAGLEPSSDFLVDRQVGEIGAVAFAGVDDDQASS